MSSQGTGAALASRTSDRLKKRKRATYEEEDEPQISPDDYVQPSAPKQPRTTIKGRSGSAPPLVAQSNGSMVLCYNSTTAMPAFHSYLPDVSKSKRWNDNSRKAIRLPYYSLNPSAIGQMQGIFVSDPAITGSTCTQLPLHLAKLQADMEANIKNTSATEATGEAAAAMYICKKYGGAKMLWGAHVHSGPGIDQIWHTVSTNPQYSKGKYIVVEAKGVGAQLSYKNDQDIPPDIRQQMSLGWIYDNLVTMQRQNYQAAIKLMKDVGLTELLDGKGNPFYFQYNKRPTSYYKCAHNPATQKAELWAIVVEAMWTTAGQFSYKVVMDTKYL